jgi:hypothetical protein
MSLKGAIVVSCALLAAGCDSRKCEVGATGALVCSDPSGKTTSGGADGGTPAPEPALGSILLAERDHDVLGASGSGYQEKANLTFQLVTPDGKPYPAGLRVTFTHESQGASFIGAVASCTPGAPSTCTAEDVTDADGRARVVLTSGRSFGDLSVRAEATGGGVSRSLVAGGFVVVGAKPNGAHLSLDCRPYNIPALTVDDCLYSHYAGAARSVDCTLEMADRNGVVIGVPTRVAFQSEAGAVSPVAVSAGYDTSKPAGDQKTLGHAVGFLEVYGSPLPLDVEPFAGEASVTFDRGCGPKKANPRDGLVTVIAVVDGEEGYADLDHNGRYDEGEPFIDLGEPYVDANDNGKWDPGEWFLDVNGDGSYTGPNGRWDANAVLWTQTRVVYTGYPAFGSDAHGNELFSRFYVEGAPPSPTAVAPPFSVSAGPPPNSAAYGVFWTDENLNPLSSFATYDVTVAGENVKASLVGPDFTADALGTSFRLLYCDKPEAPGACFAGPVEDACRSAPCYVVPDVGLCASGSCSGFTYGNHGVATVTGAKVGQDVVQVSATLEGVKNAMALVGESRDASAPVGGAGPPPPLGSILLPERDHDVLGAFGSGYQEQATLTFQLLTSEGKPYPAGLRVAFTHESQGGSFIGAAPSCAAATPSLCTAEGVTGDDGRVHVVLTSGRTFAVLSVRADATGGGVSRSVVGGGVVVVGAKPNGAHVSLDCRPYNIPALTVDDCLYSRYAGAAGTVDCTLKMADRNGVVIGIPTRVGFQSEAGAVSPVALSPAYDPSKPVTDQKTLGHALGFLEVYGSPLPVDVEPFAGEASVTFDAGCGLKKANPRDGLVTVIALVQGEEGFVDVDHNGQYDAGEPFVDLGEPYVDANDNGKWDAGEWFLDVNGDGSYTGPNGKWDANTVLWAQTRVVYTGYPAFGNDGAGNELFSRLSSSGAPPAPTAAAQPFSVVAGPPSTSTSYGVFWTDRNLNPLSAFTTYDIAAVAGNVKVGLTGPDATADALGASFRLLYCDKPQAPTACFAGPVEDACRTVPCYVVPDVGLCSSGSCAGFTYGNRGTVIISGAKAGDDVVQVSATVEGVKSTMALGGTCLP